jgi:D-sedoheptulose 7-phosphate isomerase
MLSNDFGFEMIFNRQIEGLGEPGDIMVAITTSGQSKNIYNALLKANDLKIKIIGFLGRDGGRARNLCDEHITADSNNTARIQAMHILIGHILCDALENGLNLQ